MLAARVRDALGRAHPRIALVSDVLTASYYDRLRVMLEPDIPSVSGLNIADIGRSSSAVTLCNELLQRANRA